MSDLLETTRINRRAARKTHILARLTLVRILREFKNANQYTGV
ncbi:hypothetical protein DLNHIDIE_00677 [Acidithiobacillus thiooxidans ATCC 19377]|uniref:Uncharacterized protein n=1 Tax=Acidithiobacillus thiooxidans ATCC 19377 TaxID=637390 RepID=A0A543Q3C5_ACITH|nr:hypothetical protein DLNHIDIE_00677 [Acidithiobacillus thiooxidans ATCC 19377]